MVNWFIVYMFVSNLVEVDVYSSNILVINIFIVGDDYVINLMNSLSGLNDKVIS